MSDQETHKPVLVEEVLETLAPVPGDIIVDGTLGHAGHSLEILFRMGGEGLLVGIDRDPQMLSMARQRIEAAHISPSCYRLVQADHAELTDVLAEVLADTAVPAVNGVLLDLGPSTPQLLDPRRGMSWTSDQALDMRMDPGSAGPTAADLVNSWEEDDLARLIREHSDERWARRIAKRIVEARHRESIRTGRQLGEIIAGAIPRGAWPPGMHPATRSFLALRIEVNGEFRTLEQVLPDAFDALQPGGRLVLIAFHSGEDRRVKRFMQRLTTPPLPPAPLPQGDAQAPAQWIAKKPRMASEEEKRRNPASRSAKLRAIRKVSARSLNAEG